MQIRNIFIVFLVLTARTVQAQICDSSDANRYLSVLFHGTSYISYDKTIFLSYEADKTQKIEAPLLNILLPKYCFYSTTFQSTFYEYREVETAIGLRRDSINNSVITLSPVFSGINKSFIGLFYGLYAHDSLTKIELCKEIANIFSRITYKGHFNQLTNIKHQQVISFELWHDDLSWAILDFYFYQEKLTKIEIKSGAKHGKLWDSYKRL